MQSEESRGAFIPLGDFLTAEEPVWVWDAGACRILWANVAGRNFWGASSLDALRARRFNAKSKAVSRMTSLASAPGDKREWIETLTLSAAEGRKPVKCYMQSLQVAGGRPGLIVKALSHANGRMVNGALSAENSALSDRNVPATSQTHNDRAAINAIAARLNDGLKPKSPKHKADAGPACPVAAPAKDETSPLPDALALELRELCHEIRNPLTVILGFAERIKETASPSRREKIHAYADNIVESAHLAMDILGDFSTRILQPDYNPVRAEPVEVKPAVESCLDLIAPLAKHAGLKLFRKLQKNLPSLQIGERILKQMLLNVLMNAVRHQKDGGKIKVSARTRKNGTLRLIIADDGRGMTKKEIKTALGSARRAKSAGQKSGRSGLGLPLVKKLAESAGGTLSIESARGKGTTVEIAFPPQSAR